ncbi:MAG: tetratricopeptide repeat protein [Planctomycetes bacterium]|nr:tetratricopeptide repeat protein [Planctomycetota bacterium]
MRCIFAVLVAAGALAVWTGAIAAAEENREFDLPPVKLKPERPPTAKPIPPAPDERTPPAPPAEAKPPEPPKEPAPPPAPAPEKPARTPKAPAEKAAPKSPARTAPPAEPSAPPAEPPPTVLARPVRTEAPPETALPPLPPLPPDLAREKPAEVATPGAPPREPRPEDVQKEAVEAQVRPLPEADLTGMGEVGLVEEVARTRKAYARGLMALKDFYMARGMAAKIEWINSELDAYQKVPKIQYLSVAEVAGPGLRPTRRIAAADQLFEEGMHYKDYPAFPPGKKDYLKIALEKFQTVIEKYPESDKIDDAAFRMGEIYGGWYFQDYARAVECYQRCWEWNPETEHPALFKAAKIYEENLKNGVKAVELYNRVVAEYPNEDLKKQAVDRIKALTGK